MKKHITIFATTFFLISACAPATALPTQPPTTTPIPPTATPQPTVTPDPTPTSSLTPTFEPWMQNLPDIVVTVETEGGVIFGVDAQGEKKMKYDLDTGEWVEISPYKIVREAGKESQMSKVEIVQRADGTIGLSEDFMDWLQNNPLAARRVVKTDFVFSNVPSYGNEFDFARRMQEWSTDNNPRPHSIHIISPEDVQRMGAGVAEQGFLYVYQFDEVGKEPQFLSFFVNKTKHEEIKEKKTIEKGAPILPYTEMTRAAVDRFYPRGDESGRVYDKLVANIYELQLGSGGRKLVEQLLTQASNEDRIPDELEGIILLGAEWDIW